MHNKSAREGDGDRDEGFDAMIIIVYACISINYSISMSYALMFQLLSCNNSEQITVNIQIDDLVLSEYSSGN